MDNTIKHDRIYRFGDSVVNITVNKVNLYPHTHRVGGECATARLDIDIEEALPIREQRLLVIHAILENYFRSIEHDKIDELEALIGEALDQLE